MWSWLGPLSRAPSSARGWSRWTHRQCHHVGRGSGVYISPEAGGQQANHFQLANRSGLSFSRVPNTTKTIRLIDISVLKCCCSCRKPPIKHKNRFSNSYWTLIFTLFADRESDVEADVHRCRMLPLPLVLCMDKLAHQTWGRCFSVAILISCFETILKKKSHVADVNFKRSVVKLNAFMLSCIFHLTFSGLEEINLNSLITNK